MADLQADHDRAADMLRNPSGRAPTKQEEHIMDKVNLRPGRPYVGGKKGPGKKQGAQKKGIGAKGFVVSTGDQPFTPINPKVASGADDDANPNLRPDPPGFGKYDPRIANPELQDEENEYKPNNFKPGEPPAKEEFEAKEIKERLARKLEEARQKAGDALLFPDLPVFPAPYVQPFNPLMLKMDLGKMETVLVMGMSTLLPRAPAAAAPSFSSSDSDTGKRHTGKSFFLRWLLYCHRDKFPRYADSRRAEAPRS
jgi:hypothetical protein